MQGMGAAQDIERVMAVIGCRRSTIMLHRVCVVTDGPGHKEVEPRGTVDSNEPCLQSPQAAKLVGGVSVMRWRAYAVKCVRW